MAGMAGNVGSAGSASSQGGGLSGHTASAGSWGSSDGSGARQASINVDASNARASNSITRDSETPETSIEQFAANTIGSADFQKKNMFFVVLPGAKNISFYVTATQNPTETTSSLPFHWMNSQFKLAGKTSHGDWTVTVRENTGSSASFGNTTNPMADSTIPAGHIYDYFNRWRNEVYVRDELWTGKNEGSKPETKPSMGVGGRPKNYKKTITLHLLKATGEESQKFEMVGAWPSQISAADLSYSTDDMLEFTVTFVYDYFKAKGSPLK